MPTEPFLVHPSLVAHCDGDTVVSLTFEHGGTRDGFHARIRNRLTSPPVVGDACLSVALIAAMKENRPLRLSDPVSPGLLAATPSIQGILHMWYPELHVIPIEAETVRQAASDALSKVNRGAAHFFSGGVDSFHSVLERRAGLDALVFVDGFDIAHENMSLRREVAEKLKAAAGEMRLPLVHVETDFMPWAMQFGRFGDYFLGARLALVTHLLAGEFREMRIAPSGTNKFGPFPTHPLLDPIWSSEWVQILHSVPLLSRASRACILAEHGFPLRFLRVCMASKAYNCGVCGKCQRTRISLFLGGRLDQCSVFPGSFDLDQALAAVVGQGEPTLELNFQREQIELARAIGVDDEVMAKLEAAAAILESRMLWEEVSGCGERFWDQVHLSRVPFKTRRLIFRRLLSRNPEWLLKETRARLHDLRVPLFELLWKAYPKWLFRRALGSWLTRMGHRLRGGRRSTAAVPKDGN